MARITIYHGTNANGVESAIKNGALLSRTRRRESRGSLITDFYEETIKKIGSEMFRMSEIDLHDLIRAERTNANQSESVRYIIQNYNKIEALGLLESGPAEDFMRRNCIYLSTREADGGLYGADGGYFELDLDKDDIIWSSDFWAVVPGRISLVSCPAVNLHAKNKGSSLEMGLSMGHPQIRVNFFG